MSGAVAFTVPGDPRGKGRPKFVRATGRAYTDEKTAAYENLVKLAARQAMGIRAPMSGPVEMSVIIRVCPPASTSKRGRDLMLRGTILPAKKPDADNIIKAIADGCNGVVFVDDIQAVDGVWRKRYAETPGVDVVVTPIVSGGPA